jgi:cytochrome c553
MRVGRKTWRPLAIVLAAAGILAARAVAQDMPIAERIAQCGGCHGEDGNSRLEKMPSLAGQPAFFIFNQLFLMREGVRKIESMAPIVKDLKDSELEALAAHYSKLEPKLLDEKPDPALIERGARVAATKRCTSCHAPTLAGQEQMPRLAKQRIDYMIDQMRAYLADKRSGADTAMTASIAGLSDDDLVALAHFAASR